MNLCERRVALLHTLRAGIVLDANVEDPVRRQSLQGRQGGGLFALGEGEDLFEGILEVVVVPPVVRLLDGNVAGAGRWLVRCFGV